MAAAKNTGAQPLFYRGKGNDGTGGAKTIREYGGTVLVQDESTAKYRDMPLSAIDAHLADYILSPADMPDLCKRMSAKLNLHIMKKRCNTFIH